MSYAAIRMCSSFLLRHISSRDKRWASLCFDISFLLRISMKSSLTAPKETMESLSAILFISQPWSYGVLIGTANRAQNSSEKVRAVATAQSAQPEPRHWCGNHKCIPMP